MAMHTLSALCVPKETSGIIQINHAFIYIQYKRSRARLNEPSQMDMELTRSQESYKDQTARTSHHMWTSKTKARTFC